MEAAMRTMGLAMGLVSAVLLLGPVLSHATDDPSAASGEKQLSPEEKMNSRYPQPVKAGFLIGLPLLDEEDSTIGYIQQVVRTPEGKIKLIVPYRPWLGWARNGSILDWSRRPIAVPLEAVAILARQVDILDLSCADLDVAPTFVADQAAPISADEVIKIAITRR
jgi:hypothetical protein